MPPLVRGRLSCVPFIDEAVSAYMRKLCDRYDESVLLEMEKLAEERKFPIVGRVVGVTLELLARSIRARRVFEMGSGFGFSALGSIRSTQAVTSVSPCVSRRSFSESLPASP